MTLLAEPVDIRVNQELQRSEQADGWWRSFLAPWAPAGALCAVVLVATAVMAGRLQSQSEKFGRAAQSFRKDQAKARSVTGMAYTVSAKVFKALKQERERAERRERTYLRFIEEERSRKSGDDMAHVLTGGQDDEAEVGPEALDELEKQLEELMRRQLIAIDRPRAGELGADVIHQDIIATMEALAEAELKALEEGGDSSEWDQYSPGAAGGPEPKPIRGPGDIAPRQTPALVMNSEAALELKQGRAAYQDGQLESI